MKKLLKLSGLSLVTVLMITTPALAELKIDNADHRTDNTFHHGSIIQQPVPTDASLLKLLEVMRMTEMMQSMTVAQGDMMDSVMQFALQDRDLQQITETQRQQMVRVLSDYTQQLLADSNKAMIDIAKKHFLVLAKQHYTQAEVDAQITFFSSDIGQRILDKQPTFMQAYMKAIMPETMDVVNQNQQKLKPKLMQELEQILR